ncbi:radical SAM protein [bacterium]|nr:radical SAM protein [bacterium]
MYEMKPKNLYLMDWAADDPRCVERMTRMVRGMGREPSEVQVLKAEELPEVIRAQGWIGEVRQGAYRTVGDPDLIFNASRWVTPEERQAISQSDLFKRCVEAHAQYGDCKQWFTGSRIQAMLGASPFYHLEGRRKWDPGWICWSLHDLHSAWGCVHRCSYCQRGSVYVINLNLEEFVEHVHELMAANPWQETFRYDVEQDVLAIEPEYGACEMLVNDFAQREKEFLILFSKSANVDHLLNLDHKGHTIMLWTLSTHTVSRRYEARTGTLEERLEAARKCQEAGYHVRFKCKPIIPVRNWREEITHMLECLYSTVQPENLSMETVFFDSVAEMDETLGLDALDPGFVDAAWKLEKEVGDKWPQSEQGMRPFPFEVKEEIYRHFIAESRRLSPQTPITLCAETLKMWEKLDGVVDGKPWNYVCNCGPHCVPGLRSLESIDGPDVERVAKAQRDGCVCLDSPQV